MTSLLIFLKHHCPWFWRAVEWVNGRLFALRYPAARRVAVEVLQECTNEVFLFSLVQTSDLPALSAFCTGQPEGYLAHFDPHRFDVSTFGRLLKNPAFVLMKITNVSDGSLVGYFFLRGFCIGRAFHGLLVAEQYRNRGLGSAMWSASMQLCTRLGLRMFATVSEQNAASLASACRATETVVAERLANGYLLIACKPKLADDEVDF